MKLVNAATGAEYRLTPGENLKDRLPKRYDASMTVKIGDADVAMPVTVNKGWAGGANVLIYPWILIGGRAYYVTLNADEKLEGEYRVEEGAASRPNPKRETTRVEAEQARIAAFKARMEAKKAA